MKTGCEELRDKRKLYSNELCSSCGSWDNCVFAGRNEESVNYCEEYEVGDVPGKKIEKRSYEKESIEFKGLCKTCALRKNCAMTSEKGGIWHCEEYC